MTQLTNIKMGNGQIQRLVNPFGKSDSVKLPAGTVYLDEDKLRDGEQVMAEEAVAKLFFAFGGGVNRVFYPAEFEVGSGVTGNLYHHENEVVCVRNPRINFSSTHGGWKIVTVTEEIIRHNGFVPKYEIVGEFKDGKFTSFMKW